MAVLIGVTSETKVVPRAGRDAPASVIAMYYLEAIRRAGGTPVVVPPGPPDFIYGLASRLDGLVLSGGGDIDPARYDREAIEQVYGVDESRDTTELAMVDAALSLNMPTLAICRGMQVVNVALGGTLIQDIATERPDSLVHWAPDTQFDRHQPVTVDSKAELASVLGSSEVKVNSIHHQAVDRLGDGLGAVAWAEDGIIEAVAYEGEWPLLAVQWHPERLFMEDSASAALFDGLVARALANRDAR
ncbi:MAG: gamma-glutamyl-gamma-aminobutyrate hydrolase family protein [Acidimicrobiia bacterium]|nr:gamma-glutamyl-gamma-aminobutyrate hydrolase family protein [Acidimicrobiia bacterium]